MRERKNGKTPVSKRIIDNLLVYFTVILIIILLFKGLDELSRRSTTDAPMTSEKPSTTLSGITQREQDTQKEAPDKAVTTAAIKVTPTAINTSKVDNKSDKTKAAEVKQGEKVAKADVEISKPGAKRLESQNKETKSTTKTLPVTTTGNKATKPNAKVTKVETNLKGTKTVETDVKAKKLTRGEAYGRGMNIINYVWDYNVYKNGNVKNKAAALPNYLKGKVSLRTNGIPYCWGGYLSIDKSDRIDVKNFQGAIKAGYTAGNINCIGQYKDNTAGLDCSGFVCAVFNIPDRYGTGMLSKYFNVIKRSDLKPMDILNCQSEHVIIYLRETNDKKGILIMEAARNQYPENSDKTNINFKSWDSINKGVDGKPYVAMRYKGIVEKGIVPVPDTNEYNNKIPYATQISLDKRYDGFIDYVSDVDYYTLNISKDLKYTLKVPSLPKQCRVALQDAKEKSLLSINKKGTYNIGLKPGTYYIKAEGSNFTFNARDKYSINMGVYIKPKVVKPKTIKKTPTKTIKKPAKKPIKKKII